MVSPALAIGFAAGTLLHLLLLVLVAARLPLPLGRAQNRGALETSLLRVREKRLDLLFFLLFGTLFLWHGGNLLVLALESFHGQARAALLVLARVVAYTGLAALPPLLVDVHAEYSRFAWRRFVWVFYLPFLAAPLGVRAAAASTGIPRGAWMVGFILYFSAALLLAALTNVVLGQRAAGHLRVLHRALAALFVSLAAACLYFFLLAPALGLLGQHPGPGLARGATGLELFQYLLMLSSILPSALVGYWMFRFNFLEAATQRTLALAVLALLGLLAYVLVIERLAQALDRGGYLPSTVTEAVFVFFLVLLVEPVSERVRRWISRQMAAELARVEALHGQLLARALEASPEEVRAFAEESITAFFGFPVRVTAAGELRPEAGRELKFREAGTLRLLAAHTAEALERSRLLAQRLRLEHELAEREKMAALGEMTAFIAHRLKNPLSAINTLVQVIAEQSPQAAGHCAVIREEIRRLNVAVGDLLKFTRGQEEASPGRSERVPAREALEEAAALFAAEAERKGVALECRAGPGIVLPIRSEWLHDLLTSLLGNALDAAPAGSRVLLSCERLSRQPGNSQSLVLIVEDAGPGVAPEHGEKIFDPFFTLKPGGTGLGLALARRRAREAGAEIRCVSPVRDGRGARFEVIFPESS